MPLRRWQFSLRGLMAATAAAAAILGEPRLGTLLVAAIALLVAIRTLWTQPRDAPARRWAAAYMASFVALYLPFGWVLGDYPWDSYRRLWISFWPVLPGLVAGMFAHPSDMEVFRISGFATLLLLALFTALGSSGRKSLIAAGAAALVASAIEAKIAYQLFLF